MNAAATSGGAFDRGRRAAEKREALPAHFLHGSPVVVSTRAGAIITFRRG
jgi:hypothetical protein